MGGNDGLNKSDKIGKRGLEEWRLLHKVKRGAMSSALRLRLRGRRRLIRKQHLEMSNFQDRFTFYQRLQELMFELS